MNTLVDKMKIDVSAGPQSGMVPTRPGVPTPVQQSCRASLAAACPLLARATHACTFCRSIEWQRTHRPSGRDSDSMTARIHRNRITAKLSIAGDELERRAIMHRLSLSSPGE